MMIRRTYKTAFPAEEANSTIINVTAKENRKLEIKVGISYEADIQKAKRIIEKILREDADTKSDTKEMVVFVDELADSAVIMGLRVWVSTERYWPTKWRLNQKIKEEANCITPASTLALSRDRLITFNIH